MYRVWYAYVGAVGLGSFYMTLIVYLVTKAVGLHYTQQVVPTTLSR